VKLENLWQTEINMFRLSRSTDSFWGINVPELIGLTRVGTFSS